MATIYGQKTPPPLLKRRKSQPFGRLKPPTTKDNLGLDVGRDGIEPSTSGLKVPVRHLPTPFNTNKLNYLAA